MRIRKSSVEPGGRSEMQADLARKELGNQVGKSKEILLVKIISNNDPWGCTNGV